MKNYLSLAKAEKLARKYSDTLTIPLPFEQQQEIAAILYGAFHRGKSGQTVLISQKADNKLQDHIEKILPELEE